MADGSINIDLLLNDKSDPTWTEFNAKAEKQGKSGYEKFKDAFKGDPLVAKLEAQADKAGINDFRELLNQLPKEKQTELLAKAEKGEAIDFQKFIKDIPDAKKIMLEAQAKRAGIDNFEELLKKLPKKTLTDLQTRAEKGEVINFEKELRKLPSKVVANVELNDNASTGLRSLKKQANEVGDKFHRLKDIMIGTFAANALMGGIHAITSGIKDMTKAGMEYNKEQDTMKTVWTALTTEAPEDGKKLLDYINTLSQHSIYAADDINKMAQSFYHVHSNVEETKKWTDSFVALGSTLHMTGPQISESGEMFAKIVAGGKASAEDMSVMINRFPMFGEALQKATGKSMKELYAMSAAGKLSATQFTEALDYLGEKYKGGTAEAMTSMQGMSMYLKSRLSVLSGEVMKSSFNMSKSATEALQKITSDDSMKKFAAGISSGMSVALGGISKLISYISNHSKDIIGIIGNVKSIVGLLIGGAWDIFKDTLNGIVGIFDKLTGSSKKAHDPLKSINDVLSSISKHKAIIEALGAAIASAFATKKIIEFASGVRSLIKSQKLVTAAQWLMNAAMEANPIGIVVMALVAAGAAFYELYKHNDKFKAFIDSIGKSIAKVFDKLKDFVRPITDSLIVLGKTLGEVFGDSFKALEKSFSPFVKIFKSMFSGMGEELGSIFGSIGKSIGNLTKPFREAGKKGGPIQSVVDVLDSISQWFIANKAIFIAIADVIGKVLGVAFVTLGAIIRGVFEMMIPLIKPTFNILVAVIKGAIGIIIGVFKILGSTIALIFDVITGNWKNIGKDIKGIFSGIGKIISSSLKAVVAVVANMFHALVKVIDKALWSLGAGTKPIENLAKGIVKIFKGIGSAIGKVLSGIGKLWSSAWNGMAKAFSVIGKTISKVIDTEIKGWKIIFTVVLKFISKLWSTTWNGISNVFGKIWKWLQKDLENELNFWKKIFTVTLSFITKLWDRSWDFVSDVFVKIWNGIKKFFNPIIKWLENIISDALNGIKKAWNRSWDAIFDFFSDTWNNIKRTGSKGINALKDTLGDVLGKIGKTFSDTWDGVKNGFGNMWDGMKKLAGDGINAVIKIPNAGIDGINGLIHDFGGPKSALGKIPKVAFATGTGAFGNMRRAITNPTMAILNDGNDSPQTGNKEALIHPNGAMEVIQGRNTERLLMPGTEVLNASELAMMMGGQHFASGTGFLGSIWDGVKGVGSTVANVAGNAWDGVKNTADKFTKMFGFITNAVAHPVKTLENVFNPKSGGMGNMMNGLATGSFKHVKTQATDWWKSLWGMAGDEASGGGSSSELLKEVIKLGTGKPYVWGATGPDSFDCSGLVQDALRQMGKSFPHYSGDQFNSSTAVSDPKSGDLAFFGEGGSQHVGVYGGNGKMFSAMSPGSSPNIGWANVSDWSEKLAGYHRVPGLKSDDSKSSSSNPMAGLIKGQVGGMFDWIKKFIAPTQDSPSEPAGDGVGRWKSDVTKALGKLGLSTSGGMVSKVLRQIQTESGGNASAMGGNDGLADGNATGLMQVKPGTFRAYASAGHGNIMNGYDNILAGLAYAKNTYGSDLSFLGQGHGYANGGRTHGIGIVGEVPGEDEWVTNPNRQTADRNIIGSIKETAQKQPNSFAAKLANIVNGAKSGMQNVMSQQPSIAGVNTFNNNGGVDLSGDVHMTIQMDSGEVARATYPKIKILQNQEIQLKGQTTGNTYGY